MANDHNRGVRLALLTSTLYTGGLERVVHDLALSLRERGYETEVFATRGLGVYAEWLKQSNVPVWDCRDPRPRIAGVPVRLLRHLMRFRPAILHGHSGTWLPCSVAKSVLRSPALVFTDHGRYAPEPRYRALIERWFFYPRTNRLVAVSSELADYLKGFLKLSEPADVIPNGIDLSLYETPDEPRRRALRAEWGVAPDEVLAVSVGRLERVKNHAALIDAVATIAPKAPKLRLAIIGGGRLEEQLRRQATRSDIQRRVLFLGERRDIPDCLGSADLFVSASNSEGLPVSLLEAMAARLPVLSTAVGGIPKALGTPPAGILVPPEDLTSLASELTRLATDPGLRAHLSALAARQAQFFSLEASVSKYCDLYEALLATSP